MLRRLRPAIAVAALVGAAPTLTSAQLPIPSASIVGGVSRYDLSAKGTTPFGAVRVELPLLILIAEGSLGVFRPTEEGGVKRTYIIPEAQVQWQILPLLVKPYIGVGAGYFRAISGPSPRRNDFTLSASGGVRVGLPLIGAGLRGELRVRGIGSDLDDRAAEWTVGISW